MTTTAWATLQSAGVNVRLEVETVPSVASLEPTGITTFAVGWLVRATVNVAWPPASVVTRPDAGRTEIPATSSSAFVAETSAGSRPP